MPRRFQAPSIPAPPMIPPPRIYMDNHATTRVDPRVVEAMLPFFHEFYGNPGSTSHDFGLQAREAVDQARERIARQIAARPKELVFTSGATESNNLAIRGLADRSRRRGNHLVTVATEHPSVLEPIERLGRRGFEVTILPVQQAGTSEAGCLDPQRLADALRDDTLLASVMLANNEIGAIHDLRACADVCRARGVVLHCDATQAVGKIEVDVEAMGIDLMSFTAHKIYGPKGVGALWVRSRPAPVRLEPLIHGGGQEGGRRSGTLNTPGIVGFARALELANHERPQEALRLAELRGRLYEGLFASLDGVVLNGPALDRPGRRLPGNLNLSFARVDGEALMMTMGRLAVSSGSACTSANPQPSHVLRALGLDDDQVRASLRFGLGRFNTAAEVEAAIALVAEAVQRLRRLSASAR